MKLQDGVVLEGLDVVKETVASNTPLVKEFSNIQAANTIKLELVPRTDREPIISAMWGFLPGKAGNSPRIMSEKWDSDCWLWSDAWCKLTRTEHGVALHGSHRGSINICYLDGHVKFQGGQAKLVFK